MPLSKERWAWKVLWCGGRLVVRMLKLSKACSVG